MWITKPMVALGLVLGLSACDVEGTLNKIADDAIDSAFENVKKVAEENGGAAVRVTPGVEATLEVTNQDSALFGAKVVIPAGALPSNVKQAAATIQGGGEAPSAQPDDVKVVGPVAVIAIVTLPLGAPVELQVPVSITLPYAKDTSYPTEEFALGKIAGEGLSVVGDSVVNESPSVSGEEKDLTSAFVAVWDVDYNGEDVEPGVFAYKVVKNEDVICVGRQENVTAMGSTAYIAGPAFAAEFETGTVNTMAFENVVGSGIPFDPSAAPFPQSVPAGKLTVTCGGVAYTKSSGVSGFTFVDWTEDSNAPADCAGTGDCTEGIGTVAIAGKSTFTAETGETVKVGVNITIPDFSWLY